MDHPVTVKMYKQRVRTYSRSPEPWTDIKDVSKGTSSVEVSPGKAVEVAHAVLSLPYVYQVDAYSPQGRLIYRNLFTYWDIPRFSMFPRSGRYIFIHEQVGVEKAEEAIQAR
jgi:hypothetical protein